MEDEGSRNEDDCDHPDWHGDVCERLRSETARVWERYIRVCVGGYEAINPEARKRQQAESAAENGDDGNASARDRITAAVVVRRCVVFRRRIIIFEFGQANRDLEPERRRHTYAE